MKNKLRLTLLLLLLFSFPCIFLSACDTQSVKFDIKFIIDGEVYATVETGGKEIITMPNDPTKDGYVFDGWYWDEDIWEKPFTANSLLDAPLSSNMKIYAKFVLINSFSVVWKNFDGSILDMETYLKNEIPSYKGSTPTRIKDKQYDYVFIGWDKELLPLTSNMTYIAQYRKDLNYYMVTWKNYDGTILKIDSNVPYGTLPQYNEHEPKMNDDYEFSGWSPSVSIVTENITYTAQFVKIDKNVFQFTNSYNKFTTNNSTQEEIASIISRQNKKINFKYANYRTILGKWGQLNAYGYFFNDELIPGINSLKIETVNQNDKFIISYGVKKINGIIDFSFSTEYCCSEILTITESCNYIKIFNASNSDIIINSINISYSNTEALEKNKNDALFSYEVNPDNISCIITGITNSSEVVNLYLSEYYQGYKVSDIQEGAFTNTSNLTNIRIPFISPSSTEVYDDFLKFNFGKLFGTKDFDNSIKILQKYGFSWVKSGISYRYNSYYIPLSLTCVTVDGGLCPYSFYNCIMIKSISFGDSVTKIGKYSCYGCSSLENVSFGNSATEIESSAFMNCKALKNINLKSNVYKIGSHAFEGCTIESLFIPNNITELDAYAFDGCNIVGNIYISESVTTIGKVIFSNKADSEIKPTIFCEAENVQSGWNADWNSYNYPVIYGYYGIIDNYLVCKKNGKIGLVEYYGSTTGVMNVLNNDILLSNYAIFENLFKDDNTIELIDISSQCDLITENAFNNCSNLKYVILKNGNINIEKNAFVGNNMIECLYFYGEIDTWKNNRVYNNLTVCFYSETEVSDVDNGIYYWHYENNIPVINYN